MKTLKLCDYPTSNALKEIGFNLATTDYYIFREGSPNLYEDYRLTDHNSIERHTASPTLALVQMWFEEEHEIQIYCTPSPMQRRNWTYHIKMYKKIISKFNWFSSKSEALSAGINQAIEILRERQKEKA